MALTGYRKAGTDDVRCLAHVDFCDGTPVYGELVCTYCPQESKPKSTPELSAAYVEYCDWTSRLCRETMSFGQWLACKDFLRYCPCDMGMIVTSTNRCESCGSEWVEPERELRCADREDLTEDHYEDICASCGHCDRCEGETDPHTHAGGVCLEEVRPMSGAHYEPRMHGYVMIHKGEYWGVYTGGSEIGARACMLAMRRNRDRDALRAKPTCRSCGSNNLVPYVTNPSRPKGEPQTPQHGHLCLNCRLFTPKV